MDLAVPDEFESGDEKLIRLILQVQLGLIRIVEMKR